MKIEALKVKTNKKKLTLKASSKMMERLSKPKKQVEPLAEQEQNASK